MRTVSLVMLTTIKAVPRRVKSAVASGRLDGLLVAAWISIFAFFRTSSPSDGDPVWSIRAGLDSFETGNFLARPDTWGWDTPPGLFYPNSPAWNGVLALFYPQLGFYWTAILTFSLVAATLTCIYFLARLLGASKVPSLMAVMITATLASPLLSMRATLPAQLLFLVSLLVIAAFVRARFPAGWYVLIVGSFAFAVSFVGIWIHLSFFAYALACVCAWAFIWLVPPAHLRRPLRLSLFLLGSALAGSALGLILGPYGVSGTLERTAVVAEACRELITEWLPVFAPGGSPYWPVISVFYLVLMSLAALLFFIRYRRGGLYAVSTFPGLYLALLGASATALIAAFTVGMRFVGPASLTFAPLTALLLVAVSRFFARKGKSSKVFAAASRRTTSAYWRIGLAVAALVFLPFTALAAASVHTAPADSKIVMLLPKDCKLFTITSSAALLRPDVLVWFDGRADFWGRERIIRLIDIRSNKEPLPIGATCIVLEDPLVEPSNTPLTEYLNSSDQWVLNVSKDGYNMWLPAAP